MSTDLMGIEGAALRNFPGRDSSGHKVLSCEYPWFVRETSKKTRLSRAEQVEGRAARGRRGQQGSRVQVEQGLTGLCKW